MTTSIIFILNYILLDMSSKIKVRMKYIYKILLTLLLSALCLSIFVAPVLAIDDPDSISIDGISINRHLMETDDMLIYYICNIAYGTLPGVNIDDAFVFKFIDTDNVTVLGTSEAYPFSTDGYNENVASFYFSAADAPTWGAEYIIRVQGKASVFADPPIRDFSIVASDYTSQTTQATNRTETYVNIIDIAQTLSASMSIDLLSESGTTTYFSSYGEELFRNAIPGLQAMVPELFDTVITAMNYTKRSWGTELSDNYSSTYNGTPIGNSISNLGTSLFNINFSLAASIPLIIVCVLLMVASTRIMGAVYGGLVLSAAVIINTAPLGWMPMAMISIFAILGGLYLSYQLFFKTS
jgi:hypothetical protein